MLFFRPRLPAFPANSLLVGGAARDVLRRVKPKDFDWLARDPEAAAREVAARLGGSAFEIDEERGYWRAVGRGEQHDFVPLPHAVEADLARRDFTVNALAMREDGQVIDPLGGRADLKRRTLRMVSEANLVDDPLRLLRAARLSVTLGFSIEASTRETVARLARSNLPLPAFERVRDELSALLGHDRAADGVELLEDLGLLQLYLPELREGIGVTQGGFHHLDVFRHGVEALHQLIARFEDASLTLRLATLLHDVGKPRALERDSGTGRPSFHAHDRVGAEITRDVLTRLKFPLDVVERAAALVKAHMLPLPSSPREARRFVHRRRALLPDLLRLMLADREAARGPDSTPATRFAYQAAMSLVLEALEEQPAAPSPLLRGADIMALLGVDPGPIVGEALRAVEEARAVGDVKTPEDAAEFVTSHFLRRV
ncbi:HD domain-containing protein [Deinococcus yavapaiensis]|uniref:Poly(A) polymerase n=1 Tax=Deinococcus yavapaiensis KR-236 TaxID=694435 RepID=A0A318SD80_9DEIO|nr:HD domain-containing protein [Deinococcus yavapaiensis]PYE54851.1 poly(A) polymerase [Deinococcus yavapaiensis KR-236]